MIKCKCPNNSHSNIVTLDEASYAISREPQFWHCQFPFYNQLAAAHFQKRSEPLTKQFFFKKGVIAQNYFFAALF